MSPDRPARSARTFPGAAALLLAALGCGGQPPGGAVASVGPAPDAAPVGVPSGSSATAQRYDVRAEVVELPDPDDPERSLTLRHEAIDGLVGIDGTVWGMDAMTMVFPVRGEVDLTGLAVGDDVAVELMVDWMGTPPYEVTALRRLPPDTELVFRQAQPSEQP